MIRRAFPLLCLLLLPFGCGDAATTSSATDSTSVQSVPQPELLSRLTVTRAGGIAGQRHVLTIAPDGAASLQTAAGDPKPITLTEDEHNRLLSALAAVAESAQASKQVERCIDCIEYQIDAIWDGQPLRITANDVGASPETKQLMFAVSQIVSSHGETP